MISLFLLTSLVVFVFFIIYEYYSNPKVVHESFKNFYDYNGVYCKTCPDKNAAQCSLCNNCGYGVDWNGYGRCTDGDVSGPFFNEDIVSWNYRIPGLESWYWPSLYSTYWYPWQNNHGGIYSWPYVGNYGYGTPYRGFGRDLYRYSTPGYNHNHHNFNGHSNHSNHSNRPSHRH